MLYMQNFNIKKGKMLEFQAHVKETEKAVAEHAPSGWKFKGMYAYVLGFGPYHVVSIWEATDYGDLDTWRNHEDPEWLKLAGQFLGFTTSESTPGWLLREMGDTKITEPES